MRISRPHIFPHVDVFLRQNGIGDIKTDGQPEEESSFKQENTLVSLGQPNTQRQQQHQLEFTHPFEVSRVGKTHLLAIKHWK